jgi:hypothetical protein
MCYIKVRLITSIRLIGDKRSSLFLPSIKLEEKRLIKKGPGANVIKLFSSVANDEA